MPETISNNVLIEQLQGNEVGDVDALTQMMTPTAEADPEEPEGVPVDDAEDGEFTTAAEADFTASEESYRANEEPQSDEQQSIEDEFEAANPEDGTLFDNQPGMEEQ